MICAMPPSAELPFPAHSRRSVVRIPPGGRAEIGPVNALVCRVLGLPTGGRPLRVFTTLARHRGLFRAWLRFAGRLMPFGTLPRRDAELVILRVAVLCGSDYEWRQHVVIGRRAGLSDVEMTRLGEGPDAPGWPSRDRALLQATDGLVRAHGLTDATWAALREQLDEQGAIELCQLAGHYAMLAGTLNALGVQPEGA
jgi:alkylhydroperoxidase family enzyme